MYLEYYIDEVNRTYNIKAQLNQEDLENLQLDDFDKMVVNDCMQKEGRTIADKLLAFELIFRRIEQKNETRNSCKIKRATE